MGSPTFAGLKVAFVEKVGKSTRKVGENKINAGERYEKSKKKVG